MSLGPALLFKQRSLLTYLFRKQNLFFNREYPGIRLVQQSYFSSMDQQTRHGYKEEIYSGPLTRKIFIVKSITLVSSFVGLTVQGILINRMTEVAQNIPLLAAISGVLGFFTFLSPFLIHFISRKYVVRMYYNSADDTYTAVVLTLLLREKQITFKKDEVVVPEVPGLFTTAVVTKKRIPLFFDSESFLNIDHYKKLMGYDKPIDLSFFCDEKELKSKVKSSEPSTQK